MRNKRVIYRIAPLILAVFAAALLPGCGGGYRSIAVSSVTGGVLVARAGQADAIAAYEGMKLQDRDVVTVPDSGGAVLKLDDDKYVYLEPGAKVRIGAAGGPGGTKTNFELLDGAMSAVVQKKLEADESFSVTVDNVSMMVRGTIFRVALGENEDGAPTVTVQTVEGQVDVDTGDGDEGSLGANRQAVILLTDAGGTFVFEDAPIDFSELPPEALQWIRGALRDKLDAATDPDEIKTLEEILAVMGSAAGETPLPTLAATPTITPTITPTATPTAEPRYTLRVQQSGHGAVEAAGGFYPAGAKISVHADPDDGYRFAGWLVNGASSSEVSSGASATLTMPACDVTLGAKFSLIRYTLSIGQPAEGGAIDGTAGKYAPGSRVALTVAPYSGYVLTGWLANGSIVASLGTSTAVSYRMPASNVTISAVFVRTYTLTIVPPQEGGTIGGTAGQYVPGTAIPLTATPSAGYALTEWRVNGGASAELGAAASVFYTMPNSDVTISAVFEPVYILTIVPAQGGTIHGTAGPYPYGAEIELTAEPDEEYTFANWTVNGSANQEWGTNLSITYYMPEADTTIGASFTLTKYHLDCEQAQGGTISMPTGEYAKGEVIHITVEPAEGMTLQCLVINDVEHSSYAGQTSIDFTMPGESVTISAIFAEIVP